MSAVCRPLTFLFSDIEGSTQLWERVPQQMQAALECHDAIARKAVEGHGGRLVRTMGDGIYAVFDDPTGAIGAALQLQLALSDGSNTCGLELRVRCGLHRGEAEHRDGDHYGPSVNRAARIMAIGHGQQTLLSEAVAGAVEGRLPPEVSVLDLGRVRLRDLTAPERVFQLCHAQLRALFPPLRSLEATPNNLAQQLNSFVGRERELLQVREKLAQSRLLTLLGMGGIGKSRLSVQLGAEVMDDHPDGVWLVELAPLADPQGVVQAVASVIGVKEEPGQTVLQSLTRYLRDKRVLLILDNCEHLIGACAELAKQLLQASAGCKVLASSRTPLAVAGETTYAVPTLAVPAVDDVSSAGELLRHEAVRLFVERAVAAQSSFSLEAPGAAAAVADICRRLDGIPLAIELAAARTRGLSVQTISERLNDRFRLLVTRDETVLPRQRTLRALIDWSHDLLTLEEQVLFRRLAIFAGGWTLEAAEAVCADATLVGDDVLDLLVRLVEKSLVALEPARGRYRMLDTVRHFAEEQLVRANEKADSGTRHLAFYLALAESARPRLAGEEHGIWIERLDEDRGNFVAAHDWSAYAAGGDDAGIRLMHALRPYWVHRGHLSIGLQAAKGLLKRPGLQTPGVPRCMALFSAGQLGLFMGRHLEAREFLTECLAIARSIDDHAIVAHALQPLGAVTLEQRDYAAASRYFEEALALARQQGADRELAAALTAMAMLHRMQGNLDLALPLCEQVLELARKLSDRESVGIGLLNLSMVCMGCGDQDRARELLREAAGVAWAAGSKVLEQCLIEACAGLAVLVDEGSLAAGWLGVAQARREEAGLRRDPADQEFVNGITACARKLMGDEPFRLLHQQGQLRRTSDLWSELREWLETRVSAPPVTN